MSHRTSPIMKRAIMGCFSHLHRTHSANSVWSTKAREKISISDSAFQGCSSCCSVAAVGHKALFHIFSGITQISRGARTQFSGILFHAHVSLFADHDHCEDFRFDVLSIWARQADHNDTGIPNPFPICFPHLPR